MAVSGVDDHQVGAGLGHRLRLGDDVAIDADRGADAQAVPRVDGRRVDTGTDRTGPGQHPGERPVGGSHHRDVDRSVLELIENFSRIRSHRGFDEVGDSDVTHAGEAIHPVAT